MSIARFWRETPKRYNLGGSKCTNCGTVYFPPRAVCPACTSHRQSIEKMVAFPLTGEGEVYSFTVVHDAAEGFEMQVPYVVALVKTVEGPILTGQIVDVDPAEVAIGLKVRATFRKLREEGKAGVIHYGYKFAPAEDPDDDRPARGQGAPVRSEAPTQDRARA
jgi:scaffold protein (connect acetoacetyl-CoA thiolase and HMG-CoA synthase)